MNPRHCDMINEIAKSMTKQSSVMCNQINNTRGSIFHVRGNRASIY